MKKLQSNAKTSVSSDRKTAEPDSARVKIGVERFSFRNGDSYEGGYRLDIGKRTLVKQDRGIYLTDNFDAYDGNWSGDEFAGDEFRIRYSDNARYEGNVGTSGAMDGAGTYVFPDGSSLSAIWSRNKPVSDVVYREPLGHAWTTESISEIQVTFVAGNHFWDEIASEALFSSLETENSSSRVQD